MPLQTLARVGTAAFLAIVGPLALSGHEPDRADSSRRDTARVRADGRGDLGPASLTELAAIQAQVIQVVQQNMESCVAISDGAGFGSGVIVSPDGLILTAGHVVSGGPEKFELYFPSGRTAQAVLVGYNLDVDAAMLRIVGGGRWPVARIAASDEPARGEWVVGLGHSGGYELGRKPPVRTGRVLEIRDHLVITDSVLIGGDSGGPLFNLQGELVGIHSSIGDVIVENRHVSMATFRQNWSRMLAGERWGRLPELETKRKKSGSAPAESLPRGSAAPSGGAAGSAALLGVTVAGSGQGLLIERVQPGTPAERVGLKAGDLILSVNGSRLESAEQLEGLLSRVAVGSAIQLEFRRNSSVLRLTVILQKF